VLELRIEPPVLAGECVFDLEITPAGAELQLPEGAVAEVKQVLQRAVVCDLCSSLSTGPACVTMCPHDAAFRVDARKTLAGA
jgi:Fe-S-cluster-containing hydrogenase component 2